MKERSGMPYDVVAFENDELAMKLTPCAEGVFHRMLRRAWMNGSVPADLNELAYLCRINPRTMRKLWPQLAPLWAEMEGNSTRIISKKLERERKFLEDKRKSAQSSANARWKHKKIKKTPDANAMLYSNAVPSHPIPTVLSSTNVEDIYIAMGEFKWARLTPEQHQKLTSKLNGNLENYIERFDRWVNEAPDAKKNGVRRRNRHAYESILAWFDRDKAEGRIKPVPEAWSEAKALAMMAPEARAEAEKNMKIRAEKQKRGL